MVGLKLIFCLIGHHKPTKAVTVVEDSRYNSVCGVCRSPITSGFYVGQKSPLSQRAREDARQTELIRQAWNDSGPVRSLGPWPPQAGHLEELVDFGGVTADSSAEA